MTDLDPARIRRALDDLGRAHLGHALSVVAETASTNDDARAAAAQGAPHGAAFLADTQHRGRGRGGHTWHSPPGENLYLSLLARPNLPPSIIAPITLAVGVAVAQTLEARLGHGPALAIKWPNDVYAERRKIAGILVEGQIIGTRVASLVIGVGVNVRTQAFPPDLAQRATSLALLGCTDLDRGALAAHLIAAILDATARFEADRLAPFLHELARRDLLRGERVEVSGLCGTAAGIDPEGRLLVRADDGTITQVASGEIAWPINA